MGISLGFSSSKSKSTTNQTQTPINPAWVEPQVQSLANGILGWAGQDPRSFVAPTNPLLQQAGQSAQALGFDPSAYQSANGLFGGLMNTAAPQATAGKILGNIDQYLNPYLTNVETGALRAYDEGAGQQTAQAQLAQAQSDTFGGSGGALQLAKLGSDLAYGRGDLSNNIRSTGYDKAAGWADSQANRDTQTSIANAQTALQMLQLQEQAAKDKVGTASQFYGDQLGILGAQSQIGGQLQAQDQALAGAPLSVMGELVNAYNALPLGLFQGQQLNGVTKGKSSGFSLSGGYP